MCTSGRIRRVWHSLAQIEVGLVIVPSPRLSFVLRIASDMNQCAFVGPFVHGF